MSITAWQQIKTDMFAFTEKMISQRQDARVSQTRMKNSTALILKLLPSFFLLKTYDKTY